MPRTAEDIVARAVAEQRKGRAWRAKEILRGAIAGGRLEPSILEAYGRLLDALGDRVEAGKYLFLSGARAVEHAEAIGLFMQRHSKGGGKQLLSQLPAVVRRLDFTELPIAVQQELRALGVSPNQPWKPSGARSNGAGLSGRVVLALVLVVLLFVLVALALGFWTMGSWVWTLIRGQH